MSYVEKHLSRGEQVVLMAKKNPLYLLMPLIIFVLLFILAIVGQTYLSRASDPRTVWIESQVSISMEGWDKELERAKTRAGTWGAEEEAATVEEWNYFILKNRLPERFNVSRYSQLRNTAEKFYRYELGIEYDEMAEKSEAPTVTGSKAEDEIATATFRSISIAMWVLFILIGLLPFLVRLCRFFSFSLALTNKRVVGKSGILRIHSMDYPIDKIDHVEIKAGIFGNLFKYAQLSVMSVGSADMQYAKTRKMFVGIRNAQEFKDTVTEAVERHAAEARRAQAEEIARAMGGGMPPQYPPQYPQPPRYPQN